MSGRVVVAFVAVLIVSASTYGSDGDGSVQRHARLGVDTVETDAPARGETPEDSSVLQWLDKLLTRAPVGEPHQTVRQEQGESLPTDFEASPSRPESRVPEGSDGAFPQPADIPPLYTSPTLDGEGVWTSENVPVSSDGMPLMYKTVYRPSAEYPTSVVYMALMDMSRLKARFFLGQTEPGIYLISQTIEHEELSKIVAITNAMWMQQHARGAGAIFRGQVVYPMVPGMATLVIYQDNSVDVVEWSDDIPLSLVRDARQLRHLIVKDGAVVEQVVKNGKVQDGEIGLGGFLINDHGSSSMGNKFWFLANRTAFGVRDDGNLVFAMGHHVSTKDLARALILAGCKRAIHGDANIHNIVCNFYFRDQNDTIVKRDKLSPEQLKYTLKRYDQGYSKDFFAFYEK